MPVQVRVMAAENQICLIEMQLSCNSKVSDIIDEVAEFTTENKYKLTVVFNGKQMKSSDSLAENNVTKVLCVKGGDSGPKTFMRFTQMDAPERQLTYLSDDENLDAITFIPTKDISFVGFSVYAVGSSKDDFTCHWRLKIGDKQQPQQ